MSEQGKKPGEKVAGGNGKDASEFAPQSCDVNPEPFPGSEPVPNRNRLDEPPPGEPRARTYLAGEEPWTADDLNEIAACGVFGVFRRMLKATERAAIACFANQKRRDDTESPFRWGTSHEPQYLAAGVIQDMQAAVDRLKEAAALEQGYWLNVDPDASSEARRLHKAGKFPWNRDKNSRALFQGKGDPDGN